MSILEISNVKYRYLDGKKERSILKGVNNHFDVGTFYSILGKSGSGKTTLISLITALDEPHEGNILYNGEDIKKKGYTRYRKRDIGIVFQAYNLIPYLTGLENVLVAISISDSSMRHKRKIALELLESVGIDKTKASRVVTKLSGGEQQRIAIARALSSRGQLIVADEPTGNLDKETAAEIVELFQAVAHDMNKCVIVVTHSDEVAKASDVNYKMIQGTLK